MITSPENFMGQLGGRDEYEYEDTPTLIQGAWSKRAGLGLGGGVKKIRGMKVSIGCEEGRRMALRGRKYIEECRVGEGRLMMAIEK